MSRLPAKPLLVAAAMAALASPGAWAKSSDRNQNMEITAGATSGSLDDRQPTVLSKGVTITQGSLKIESSTATISTRNGDPVRAVLTGDPVKLTQQLDDGTPMNAVAERVDYDLNTEIVIFSGDVTIQQPRGSLSGQRVVYNMKTGMMNSGGEGNGRVKMTIKPRSTRGSEPATPATRPEGN